MIPPPLVGSPKTGIVRLDHHVRQLAQPQHVLVDVEHAMSGGFEVLRLPRGWERHQNPNLRTVLLNGLDWWDEIAVAGNNEARINRPEKSVGHQPGGNSRISAFLLRNLHDRTTRTALPFFHQVAASHDSYRRVVGKRIQVCLLPAVLCGRPWDVCREVIDGD